MDKAVAHGWTVSPAKFAHEVTDPSGKNGICETGMYSVTKRKRWEFWVVDDKAKTKCLVGFTDYSLGNTAATEMCEEYHMTENMKPETIKNILEGIPIQ